MMVSWMVGDVRCTTGINFDPYVVVDPRLANISAREFSDLSTC